MNKLKQTIEKKLGDHPNVSSDPSVQPDSGIGKGANQGDDAGKSFVQNKIEAGQGSGDASNPGPRAGGTTAPDTVSAGTTSGVIGDVQS
ncbi:hypothetical protein LTR17_009141 [Elasticomyces elasticus]|nr:hypothetical protein LTR17_009141 [Elasticomyces elasticus]